MQTGFEVTSSSRNSRKERKGIERKVLQKGNSIIDLLIIYTCIIGLLLTYLSLSTGEYFYNRIGWGWLLVADRNNSANLECQLSTATTTLNEIFEVWGPGDCSFSFCHLHPFCCLCHLCLCFWCCPCCANIFPRPLEKDLVLKVMVLLKLVPVFPRCVIRR